MGEEMETYRQILPLPPTRANSRCGDRALFSCFLSRDKEISNQGLGIHLSAPNYRLVEVHTYGSYIPGTGR
jgi:hypothetical protein